MTVSSLLVKNRRFALAMMSALLILSLLLTACGGNTQSNKSSSLTFLANSSGDYPRNFNPYSPSVISGTQGMIYETLLSINRLDGTVKPWLAANYQLASDATSITFHLRQDVQWSDGQKLTSADVAFTLNLLKQSPAMDVNSIVPLIKDIATPDASTITVTLNKSYNPIVWYLGGQTYILSRHEWARVTGDASQFADPNPIGTGPYIVKTFTPQLVTLTKNPKFRLAGQPAVSELKIPAFNSNSSAELALQKGQIDWTNLYIPDIQKTFLDVDKTHNHSWMPASDILMLYLNLTRYPFNLLPVRKAISEALNRTALYQVGESGFEPVASPTALLPANKDYVAPEYTHTTFTQNATGAMSLLESAGFHKGSDGIYVDGKGKRMEFSLNVVNGYTDWVTDSQLITNDFKNVGIKVNVSTLEYDAHFNALQSGNYDMSILWTNPGPSPYYIYDSMLRSTNSAPIGQQASTNYERWMDPQTDALLNQYAGSTDKGVQKQAIMGLEKIMVEQLPSIPLTDEPYWYQYRTSKFVGWPDAQHPYEAPGTAEYPDIEYVVLNLSPAS